MVCSTGCLADCFAGLFRRVAFNPKGQLAANDLTQVCTYVSPSAVRQLEPGRSAQEPKLMLPPKPDAYGFIRNGNGAHCAVGTFGNTCSLYYPSYD